MSKYEFKMPELGEGMAEGTIGEWHVKVGDTIQKDADMVEIETTSQPLKFHHQSMAR